jgi:uncharacterized protein (DUF1778 family)
VDPASGTWFISSERLKPESLLSKRLIERAATLRGTTVTEFVAALRKCDEYDQNWKFLHLRDESAIFVNAV